MVRASLKKQSPPSLHRTNHPGKAPLSATGLVGLVESDSEARNAESDSEARNGISEAPLAGPVGQVEAADRIAELQGTSEAPSAVPVGKAAGEPEGRNVQTLKLNLTVLPRRA